MQILTIDYQEHHASTLFCESLKNTGFAVLNKHPINIQLINELYAEWFDFFKEEEKHQYLYDKKTQDGYFPLSVAEKAKGAEVKDIKEFFQYYPWGQFPVSMSKKTSILYNELTKLASQLLGWLEQGLPDSIVSQLSSPLSQMIEGSDQTMLRLLHYPPLSGTEPAGSVRAAAHEDINLITLLVGATTTGLQVQNNHGQWFDVPSCKESIIVNVGDMLSLATQNYYRSTTHRVINPVNENHSRLSMPLFLHPRSEIRLSPTKTAKEYLHERLRELGVL